MFTNIERAVRFLRLRRGWSQGTLAERSGGSRELISRAERGALAGMTLGSIDRITAALGASVHIQVRWQGEQLDRLIDAAHAGIQNEVAESLTTMGWVVRVETSFNHFGDRGRVDVAAYHQRLRALLIIEVKSALGDLQETVGRLDVKVRLGSQIARELGWSRVASVTPALVIGDSRAARRTVTEHVGLFARYELRGRAATAWLRQPREPIPAGLLWFASRPDSHHPTVSRGRRAPSRPSSQGA